MASLRHFPALTKNSLCSNSFVSTEKCSDGLIYTKFYLKNKNYILNHLKILGLYPLLENFIINLTLTNYFKVRFYSKTYLKPNTKAMTILLKP